MAVDAIGNLTGDIVEASDSADKFKSTLNFAGLDTGTIDALTASTQTYADQTVYSISDIRNVTAQLAANGVQGFDQLAEAAGNLNAVAGGNAETFSSVGMVLTQTAGAGKLTTENWNQLADAIPGASGKLQEAMLKNGAYTGNFRDAMETIRENYPSPAFYGAMNFLSTHDTPRLLTLLGCKQPPADRDARAHYRLSPAERERGTALLKLAALVLYAFPGSPTVYYGDEAGMDGFEDPFNRRTYPWGHEDTALLDWFRTLGRLRAERKSLQSGGITYPLAAGRVLCFARRADDEVSLCAVNAGAESASVDLPWAAPLAHDALSGQSFLAEGGRLHITLAPYDALLLTE